VDKIAMFWMHLDDPIELSNSTEIQNVITAALEEVRQQISNEFGPQTWSKVREILHGAAKQRFFYNMVEKLPSTLQGKAFWAAQLNRRVVDFHIKYENLDNFLIQLNYFLGTQADLHHFRNASGYTHKLPQVAPERSAFYNFLEDLGASRIVAQLAHV
jgi:hypothetical protein